MLYLIELLYIAIPIASVVFFVLSLVRYLGMKRRNRYEPDTFSPRQVKKQKILMILSAILMGVVLTVFIGFAVLLILAIAYM